MFFFQVPGPIEEPTIRNIDSTSINVIWNPPEDPNGMIIEYNVEYSPVRFNEQVVRSSRRRRREIVVDSSVIECISSRNISNNGSDVIVVPGTRTFQVLTDLS